MKVKPPYFLFLAAMFAFFEESGAKSAWRAEYDSLLMMEDSSAVNWPQAARFITLANADPNSELALRTVRTLGIIGDTLTAEVLIPILKFRGYRISSEAAFALGQMGGKKGRLALEEAALDGPPELAAGAVEALAKLADSGSVPIVDKLLLHQSPTVRYAAAVSAWKFKSRRLTPGLSYLLSDSVPRVRFGAAWSLARFPDSAAISALQQSINDADGYVRAQVVRPLGALKVKQAAPEVAGLVQADPDWKVRVNACRALAAMEATGQAPVLRRILTEELAKRQPNYHLTVEAAMALGTLKDAAGTELLRRLAKRPETFLRAWAAVALASYKSAAVVKDLDRLATDEEWRVRAKAAEGLGTVGQAEAFEVLKKLISDPDYRVRYAALGGMGEYKDKDLRPYLQTGLGSDDFAMAATACEIIGVRKDTSMLSDIVEVYQKNINEKEIDFKLSWLDAAKVLVDSGAAAKGDERVDSLLRMGLADPDRLIRKKAIELGKSAGRDFSHRLGTFRPTIQEDSILDYVHRLQEYHVFVTLATEEGDVTIELLGDRAPRTAANFWLLCAKGYFSGRAFHRVVPNFVVQDGCNRGDGWGGPGYTIRCEYNGLTYERGTVGMALSGKDTGGSQFFICHAPQPHLDGRYTIFGRVVNGMDVVDQIQIGDAFEIKSIALQKIE
ncbi:MAG: HEAT repeat domain-containing protein [candidate division Zixibacteria bacterium]|nr:HEAT repeat domain-containing protein [candidate division Zixibacteria bacterium]